MELPTPQFARYKGKEVIILPPFGEHMPVPTGSRLGPYAIESPVSTGGMGEVYRALDTRLGRNVAIKVLRAHLSSDVDLQQRFLLEASIRTFVRFST